ncbi:MAG: HAD-IB family hydrolase [Gemmatimonadota bacterium]
MRQQAAFFDVDGTLIASNIVRYGVEIRTGGMGAGQRKLWIAAFLPRVPYYLALDSLSREAFQRAFYRIYRPVSPQELRQRAAELFEHHIRPRLLPAAVARVANHRDRGHRGVLVSGSLAEIVQPVAEHLEVDDIIAVRLAVSDGVHTGELEGQPLAGQTKADAVSEYAAENEISLSRSFAYADSLDDVPMLETIGRPAVVNPGRRLLQSARERGWGVYVWDSTIPGTARQVR